MFAFFVPRELRYVSDVIQRHANILFCKCTGQVFYGDITALVADWQHIYALTIINSCLSCYTKIYLTYLTYLYGVFNIPIKYLRICLFYTKLVIFSPLCFLLVLIG